MSIGSVLARLISERGMTRREVAQGAEVSESTLNSIINRDSMSVDLEAIQRIARYLGVTVEYICRMMAMDKEFKTSSQPGPWHGVQAPNRSGYPYSGLPRIGEISMLMDLPENMSNWLYDTFLLETESGCTQMDMMPELEGNYVFLKINDNCMSPVYICGDVIVVQPGQEPETGEYGVYSWNGKLHLRRQTMNALTASSPYASTRAVNEKYTCYGRVVGHLWMKREMRWPDMEFLARLMRGDTKDARARDKPESGSADSAQPQNRSADEKEVAADSGSNASKRKSRANDHDSGPGVSCPSQKALSEKMKQKNEEGKTTHLKHSR